jgi:hypothetical protein
MLCVAVDWDGMTVEIYSNSEAITTHKKVSWRILFFFRSVTQKGAVSFGKRAKQEA